MSKYFVLPEKDVGSGGQIYFRKGHPEYNWYNLFLDEIKIGKIMAGHRTGWVGLSYAQESEWFGVRMLEGFATRMDAATFVIKHNGYWMHREKEMAESNAHSQK